MRYSWDMNSKPLKKDLNHQDFIKMPSLKTNLLLGFLLIFSALQGQMKSTNADSSFDNLFYVRAAQQYQYMVDKGNDSQHVLERLADAYYFNTDMDNAVKWYGKLFSKYEKEVTKEYAFRYVHALKGTGQYELAKA